MPLRRFILGTALFWLLAPALAFGQAPACQAAVTPAQAQGLYDALQALPKEPACELGDLSTDLNHVQLTWTHQGQPGTPLRIDASCGQLQNPWQLQDAPALRLACPRTWAAIQGLLQAPVRAGQAGVQVEAAAQLRHAVASVPTTWPRALLVLGVALGLLLLVVLRRRVRSGSFAAPDWQDVALALCLGGLAAFALAVLDAARAACLGPGDLAWALRGLDLYGLLLHRPLLALEASWTLRLADLDPGRALGLLAGVHVLNGVLLGLFARQLGLSRPWALVAALLLVACPPLTDAMAPNSACEMVLLSALLTLANAYVLRARAASAPQRRWLLALELLAVALGFGNKESFLLYIGLLAALEWLVLTPPNLRTALRRLAPHLLLMPVLLLAGLPVILANPTLTSQTPRTPLGMLGQLAHMAGTAAGQALVGPFGPKVAGAVVLTVLALLVAVHRHNRLLRLAILLMLLTALPMVVLANRPASAYLYQPWAGLALSAAVLLSVAHRHAVRALAVLWLVLLFASVPVPPPTFCVLQADTRAAVAAIAQPVCEKAKPIWEVPLPLRETLARRWRSGASLLPLEQDAPCAQTDPAQPLETWTCLEAKWRARRHLGESYSAVAQIERLAQMRCRNARLTVK